MGKDNTPPPAPNYADAAQATAQGNLDAARLTTKANRVNQYTPYGSQTWTSGVNGDPDQWRMDVSLSPDQQQLLNKQNSMSNSLADVGLQGVGYVQNMLNKPFDTNALPAQQINAGQTAQDAIMSRLDPKFGQSEEALRTRMANQGIAPGTEAWNNEMRNFNEGKNDAYTQAALQGMGIGQQARQQAMQEQSFLRNEPINTLNAVRTGSQVTNPTFSNAPQQQYTGGANTLGAAQAQYQGALNSYNAEQAQQNNMMNGLFGLGSAALMGGLYRPTRA